MGIIANTISIGEIIAILIPLGLAINANEEKKRRCIVKINNTIAMLDNASGTNLTDRDLSSILAELANRGMAHSSSMFDCFSFWSKEYLLGTIKPGGTAAMHFKKPLYEHLLEIIKLRPTLCTGLDYYSALHSLRNSLINFLKSYYKAGITFYRR